MTFEEGDLIRLDNRLGRISAERARISSVK